jgi:O-antigen ligase
LIERIAERRSIRARIDGLAVLFLLLAGLAALAIACLPLPLVAGLVAGVSVLILTAVYPLLGLGVALLLGPFGALESIILGPTLLDSGQLALMLTFAAWIGSGLARRRLFIPRATFNLPWLLFVLIAALSLLDTYSMTLGLVELLKWLEMGLIVWLILDIAADPTRRPTGYPAVMRLILAMLLFAGLVQAVIGIWQFGLRGTGPEHFIVLDRFYRAYGTFEQPNPFGGYMNMTALLALGAVIGIVMARLERRRDGRPSGFVPLSPLWFLFVLLCATAATLGLVLSWSRGAWLGFLAGAAVLVLFSTRRFLTGFTLMAAAVVILGGGLAVGVSARIGPALAVAERLGGFREEFRLGDVRGVDINDDNYSVLERLAHWQAAAAMARDDLWTGVGFGNYAAAYPSYALINFPDALGHAHNFYLNLLAEVGVPGLLAYILFWLVITEQTIRLARRLAWPERGVVVGLLAAWAALAVHHLVDKLYVNNIYVHLGAMLGLLQLFAWSGFWADAEGHRPVDILEQTNR